jgi:hypothetical protein
MKTMAFQLRSGILYIILMLLITGIDKHQLSEDPEHPEIFKQDIFNTSCILEYKPMIGSGSGDLRCNMLVDCCGAAGCGGAGSVNECIITCVDGPIVVCNWGDQCKPPTDPEVG